MSDQDDFQGARKVISRAIARSNESAGTGGAARAASEARDLVNAQADDDGLWGEAVTAMEAYVQAALRALHAAVERDTGGETGPFAARRAAPAAEPGAAAPAPQRFQFVYEDGIASMHPDAEGPWVKLADVRAGAPGRTAPVYQPSDFPPGNPVRDAYVAWRDRCYDGTQPSPSDDFVADMLALIANRLRAGDAPQGERPV